eukprot:13355456-Heterocapsa_arctica.AAC.1
MAMGAAHGPRGAFTWRLLNGLRASSLSPLVPSADSQDCRRCDTLKQNKNVIAIIFLEEC